MAKTKTRSQRETAATPKGNQSALDTSWHRAFLDAFADCGMVSEACKCAGISRPTAYRHRQACEDFALAWHDIEEATTDRMEREAYRRAALGVDEPIFYKGEEVATVKKYSDTLLIFMLKSRKPDVYREQFDLRHSGKVETPSDAPDLSKLSLEELRQWEALMKKASAKVEA